MGQTRTMASSFQRTGGTAKILQFSSAYPGKQPEPSRGSWSSQAGVSDAERFAALAFGALITPAVWAGHSLLVWMHVL